MRVRRFWLVPLSLSLLTAAFSVEVHAKAASPTKDIASASDHPALKRYEGSFIVEYDKRAFDEVTLALSQLKQTQGRDRSNNRIYAPEKKLDVQGERTRIVYILPQGRSPLEGLKGYEDEIKAKGGKVLFSCKAGECGGDIDRGTASGGGKTGLLMSTFPEDQIKSAPFSNGYCALTSWIADLRYLAATYTNGGSDSYVAVLTYVVRNPHADCRALDGRTIAIVTALDTKARESKMVTVKSSEMASTIATQGRIALYGIQFDFDKAEVKPESRPQLEEIAKLLKADPKLRLLVVGHTDNKGAFEYNRSLSERRAKSTVDELVKRYGIAGARLIPVGVGMAAPIASNADEPGRAKNRRVELVQM